MCFFDVHRLHILKYLKPVYVCGYYGNDVSFIIYIGRGGFQKITGNTHTHTILVIYTLDVSYFKIHTL